MFLKVSTHDKQIALTADTRYAAARSLTHDTTVAGTTHFLGCLETKSNIRAIQTRRPRITKGSKPDQRFVFMNGVPECNFAMTRRQYWAGFGLGF